MNIFNRITMRQERNELKEELERLRDKLIHTEGGLQEVANERDLLNRKVAELSSDNKYKWLFFLPSGQGELFKKFLESHEGKPVKFENLCCPGMYFSDRNSMIYEIVSEIVIKDLTITNSHFENACFDNVTFLNVTFDRVYFYKAFFDNVLFEKCTFNRCDFTEARGVNLVFNNCIENDTDLTVEVLQEEIGEDIGPDDPYDDEDPYEDSEPEETYEDSEKATEDKEKFFGYCFETVGGKYYPKVTLFGPEEVFNYVNLQKNLFDEVRITDTDDCLAVHALKGKIIFPEEWVASSE
ncbi:hypothetical protein Desaci_4795 (plasmid) [Desulfosporosinus acidiphilus SJ4]|uniref:Uncharacterized protein n=1 Tax=Desulfosporosinus acidiphilus (strain DSM 22704 / JCM 16185 / SJ4) TaxID=646529 RepID=I4DCU5_DESAJ|nr:pentapeptide repeat-containing protein [Desulfosporosinus acidiphilus]AFM43619.1 hypothetical protein Desaci_4795 [Desulfosporosinus acidiphilus SJ4]